MELDFTKEGLLHQIGWFWAPALQPSPGGGWSMDRSHQRVRLISRGSVRVQRVPLWVRMNFTATICTQEVAEMSLAYLSDSQESQVHTFQAQKEFIRVYKLVSSTRIY